VVLSKYHIVSTLLALLLHESLDSREKFSIILAIGHCTEDCGKFSINSVCVLAQRGGNMVLLLSPLKIQLSLQSFKLLIFFLIFYLASH
jgi:hypothetical protein